MSPLPLIDQEGSYAMVVPMGPCLPDSIQNEQEVLNKNYSMAIKGELSNGIYVIQNGRPSAGHTVSE
jgi:hypothetical protein